MSGEATERLRAGGPGLVLCDLGALPKLGVKGPGAEGWLRRQQVEVPAGTYDTARLADGGLIARLGAADFFLEGAGGDLVPRLSANLAGAAGAYRVERQDATLVVAGDRAVTLLARLSAVDLAAAPARRLILTRAGGVNCAVLPDRAGQVPVFRLWVDPSYAVSFWEALVELGEGLDGRVVEAARFSAELGW